MKKTDNPYLDQVWSVLPRLLALYDRNPVASTFGMGDRFHWAWKLVDFGNGTFQGAANGLAQLVAGGLLPEWLGEDAALERIDAMFQGAGKLRRSDGSLEEAFPYESSFCVTALVAFDLTSAVLLLKDNLSKEKRDRYLGVIRPMIRFLHKADETHGFISNHLATAAAACFKWEALTGGEGSARGREILDRILERQNEEGWFPEYEGADPGYQTLCTSYLADLHLLRPDLELLEPLRKSVQFLWFFAHPDGSFGGLYGSRNTRFYYPDGMEALAGEIPEAAALARFMRPSIRDHRTVALDVMDEPNLVPTFNAYCRAAVLFQSRADRTEVSEAPEIPALRKENHRKYFRNSGILVDGGARHYTVISLSKGGVCYHFPKTGERTTIDAGTVVRDGRGRLFTSQNQSESVDVQIEKDRVVVVAPLAAIHNQVPTPSQFILLRMMNVTVMRVRFLREWIKKLLVKYLITGSKEIPVRNRRTIVFGPDLKIEDALEGKRGKFRKLDVDQPFSAMHMASQGYWQRQDDET